MANHSPDLDHVFNALADPTRRAVVGRLCEGRASVGSWRRPFDMALPSFMKHIRVLEQSGLVRSEKSGRVRVCALRAEAFDSIEAWVSTQRAIWEQRLDRLESYVATMKQERKRHDGTDQ